MGIDFDFIICRRVKGKYVCKGKAFRWDEAKNSHIRIKGMIPMGTFDSVRLKESIVNLTKKGIEAKPQFGTIFECSGRKRLNCREAH